MLPELSTSKVALSRLRLTYSQLHFVAQADTIGEIAGYIFYQKDYTKIKKIVPGRRVASANSLLMATPIMRKQTPLLEARLWMTRSQRRQSSWIGDIRGIDPFLSGKMSGSGPSFINENGVTISNW
jgi:hypothetical protein